LPERLTVRARVRASFSAAPPQGPLLRLPLAQERALVSLLTPALA
jgi:hypothetical protein